MFRTLVACLAALFAVSALPAEADWIQQSNRHANVLLEVMARYSPETAASLGVEGYDDDVFDLKAKLVERQDADLAAAIESLEQARANAADKLVQLDLDILIRAARDQRETLALNDKLMLPFFDLSQSIFRGFQNLLDARVEKERQRAALVRLRRYIGAEQGYEPIAQLARERYEEVANNSALLGPWIVEAEQYLENQHLYFDGIEDLLEQSGLKGWQKDLRTLRSQFDDYAKWVRSTVLPRARKTNQLPAELYADNLKNFGVHMEPREVMQRALASYGQTRGELESVARQLAAQRKWSSDDYRDVIRELKKEQIEESKLLELYTGRLKQIEEIVELRTS